MSVNLDDGHQEPTTVNHNVGNMELSFNPRVTPIYDVPKRMRPFAMTL